MGVDFGKLGRRDIVNRSRVVTGGELHIKELSKKKGEIRTIEEIGNGDRCFLGDCIIR